MSERQSTVRQDMTQAVMFYYNFISRSPCDRYFTLFQQFTGLLWTRVHRLLCNRHYTNFIVIKLLLSPRPPASDNGSSSRPCSQSSVVQMNVGLCSLCGWRCWRRGVADGIADPPNHAECSVLASCLNRKCLGPGQTSGYSGWWV